MADTATVKQENGTVAETTQETRTFTQEEVNSIVEGRVAKERAKYANYEELQTKASKFDEMEEANKSELQRATEKADALQKQLDELTRATSLRDIRDKVSAETGVPSNLLSAETEEACRAQAEAILSFAQGNTTKYPTVKDGGEVTHHEKRTAEDQFADWFSASLNQ